MSNLAIICGGSKNCEASIATDAGQLISCLDSLHTSRETQLNAECSTGRHRTSFAVQMFIHMRVLKRITFSIPTRRHYRGAMTMVSTCPGATDAVDQVLADKTEKMLMLPDGGGFFIKDLPVGSIFPL